jgi:hypothetical protein
MGLSPFIIVISKVAGITDLAVCEQFLSRAIRFACNRFCVEVRGRGELPGRGARCGARNNARGGRKFHSRNIALEIALTFLTIVSETSALSGMR